MLITIKNNYLDVGEILRFPREIKTRYFTQWNKNITVPTSSQSRLSLSIWQMKNNFPFKTSCCSSLVFSLSTSVSSTNKTDCHDIAEILLKVALSIIAITITILLQKKRFKIYVINSITTFAFRILKIYLWNQARVMNIT